MPGRVPKTVSERLWSHQHEAVKFLSKRFGESATTNLVRMPTGTGKSGVIATVAQFVNPGSTLILTPWKFLKKQLENDVRAKFWSDIAVEIESKPVFDMIPSTAVGMIRTDCPSIFVATLKALLDIYSTKPEVHEAISNAVDLVIVDEGHYEPAVSWGRAVKAMNVKTVIMTATPYRNDQKLFRIEQPEKNVFHYTHAKAVEDGVIRDVHFVQMEESQNIHDQTDRFFEQWQNLVQNMNLPSPQARALITCDSHEDIVSVVERLRTKHSVRAVGVHEQFSKRIEGYLLKDVPYNMKDVDVEIWVHQNKLTEGVDDHRLCCLGLFTSPNNDRKLVQQIGRILRKRQDDQQKPSIVVSIESDTVKEDWNAYLNFEKNASVASPDHYRELVNKLIESQPEAEYISRRFRKRFNPDELADDPQVLIPPTVLVRKVTDAFRLSTYIDEQTDVLAIEDAVILGPDMYGPCVRSEDYALWIYVTISNSRILSRRSLYEFELECHCVVHKRGYLFITDTKGYHPDAYIESNTVKVPDSELLRYFDDSFKPTNVSVTSAIPSSSVVRGANLRSSDLRRIPSTLTDRVKVLTSVRGISVESGRRFIGINAGRLRNEVSELERGTYELQRYLVWIEHVVETLTSDKLPSSLINRYMPPCEPPSSPEPALMTIDLLTDEVQVETSHGDSLELVESSNHVIVVHKGNRSEYAVELKFRHSGNNETLLSRVLIEYEAEKRRYRFSRLDGPEIVIAENNAMPVRRIEIASYLNRNQKHVLIADKNEEKMYQGGSFYAIDYRYAEDTLLRCIMRIDSVTCNTEKGTESQLRHMRSKKSKRFANDSMFRLIAEGKVELPFEPEFLICDDMGDECADFIAIDFTSKRLALIHAKVGSGAKVSASQFHIVVSQAHKNLVYLSPGGPVPPRVLNWNNTHRWNQTGVRPVIQWKGKTRGKNVWSRVQKEIISAADSQIYVVLATSGCCEKPELEKAVRMGRKRPVRVGQLFYLLGGLLGEAAQIGAKLLVWDVRYSGK